MFSFTVPYKTEALKSWRTSSRNIIVYVYIVVDDYGTTIEHVHIIALPEQFFNIIYTYFSQKKNTERDDIYNININNTDKVNIVF